MGKVNRDFCPFLFPSAVYGSPSSPPSSIPSPPSTPPYYSSTHSSSHHYCSSPSITSPFVYPSTTHPLSPATVTSSSAQDILVDQFLQPAAELLVNPSNGLHNSGNDIVGISAMQNMFVDSDSILQFKKGVEEASKFLPRATQLVKPTAEFLVNPSNGLRGNDIVGTSASNSVQNMFIDSDSILMFKKGLEEASKFLPRDRQPVIDLESNSFFDWPKEETLMLAVKEGKVERLRGGKNHNRDDSEQKMMRRIRRPFSVPEVEALVQAVEKLGTGRWRDVKMQAFDNAEHRTYVDLKDKWKTLVHTASISPRQRKGEAVPQELLDRVLSAHAYWSQYQA